MPPRSFKARLHSARRAKMWRGALTIALSMLLLAWRISAASSAEITVSCGKPDTGTTIRTGSALRNLKAIHITVDPANSCHIDVSIELKNGRQKKTVAKAKVPKQTEPTAAANGARCFGFAGKKYCE